MIAIGPNSETIGTKNIEILKPLKQKKVYFCVQKMLSDLYRENRLETEPIFWINFECRKSIKNQIEQ